MNPNRSARLESLLKQRIVILDGAMGTMIQGYQLDEAGYRGARFKDFARRKNMPLADAERWLAPYLAYDSAPAPAASTAQSAVA